MYRKEWMMGLCVAASVLAGCAAPQPAPTPPQGPGASPAPLNYRAGLEDLYRAGRLADLSSQASGTEVWAESQAPEILGLLAAARGQPDAALRLLSRVAPGETTNRCIPLEKALIQFYQRGDAAGARQALDGLPRFAPCSDGPAQALSTALAARLAALGEAPVFAVEGPAGEQLLTLEPVSANAGLLVVRLVFGREQSGLFLLSGGTSDLVIDRALARTLGLAEGPPMPASDVPGLTADGETQSLPTSVVPSLRLGLFTVRNAPALIADLGGLKERFRLHVSRDVTIGGILPVQRVFGRGYIRLQRHGTDLRVAQDDSAAGPCRLQHTYSIRLYQVAGALFGEGGVGSGPQLLLRLGLDQRWTLVRQSLLRTDPVLDSDREKGDIDVAHPPVTEIVPRSRLTEATLHVGQAGMTFHHLPLLDSRPRVLLRPQEHGTLATDLFTQFDVMVDMGNGHLFLAPMDQVRCQ